MIQQWFGYTAPRFVGSRAGSRRRLRHGRVLLRRLGVPSRRDTASSRDRLPGMMTLISLAITVAFLFSVAVTLGFVAGMALWWELATLVDDHAARPLDRDALDHAGAGRVQRSLRSCFLIRRVRLDEAGNTGEVPVCGVAAQATCVLIRPGAQHSRGWRRAAKGQSALNESMITGESQAGGQDNRTKR